MAGSSSPKLHTVQVDDHTEVYEHAMYDAVDQYIAAHDGIDLAKDITQYQWKAVLYHIHDTCFQSREYFRRHDRDNNAYDYDLINSIYNIYKKLCVEYNKIIFLADFSILTGIDDEVITTWSNASRLNVSGNKIHQKIMRDNENAVSTMMISTGRNPVGFMAILNHYHGWNMPSSNNGTTEARRTQEEIAAAHGLALEDHRDAPPPPRFVQSAQAESLPKPPQDGQEPPIVSDNLD